MKRISCIALLTIMLLGCKQEKAAYVALDGFIQGTTYHFVLQTADTTGLQHQIDSVFTAVDMSMSGYNPQSLINMVNANQTDSIDRFIAHCISVSREMSELSSGTYDITIKPITKAIGYAGGAAQKNPNIDSLLQYVGYDKIEVHGDRLVKANPAMQVDLNSVAQGYTSDLMGELMDSRGIKNYMIEIGGEIFCRGKSPRGGDWVVGIDRPTEGNMTPGNDLQATLALSEMGLATSGNYRKFHLDEQGRKVTHIVNAKTGQSGYSNVLSATVVAGSGAQADAAATMLTIVGLERAIEILAQRPSWMAFLVFDDGKGGLSTYSTDNLKERITNN